MRIRAEMQKRTLNHNDFGPDRSSIMYKINSNKVKRDRQISFRNLRGLACVDKPVSTFSCLAPNFAMLRYNTAGAAAWLLFAASVFPFQAGPAAGAPHAAYAQVGEATSVPYGWADFCRRYADECDDGQLPPQSINLTPKALKEIVRVDRWVNAHVEPMSDMEHWGVLDQWDYPSDGKGDCEDYALLKRKLLIEEGFPRQALLMTVVKDRRDEGHAILTIATNVGDFVLDNLNSDMKPWDQTGYRFVKRQSQTNQNVWVQIGDPTVSPDYVSR